MRLFIALSLLIAVGCAKKRDPAPEDMEELVRYIYANYEDEAALSEGTQNLIDWLGANIGQESLEKGYAVLDLRKEDVTVPHPDRAFDDLLGAAGGGVSAFDIDVHARSMLLTDQVWSNPSNYDSYARVVEGEEAAFLAGEGDILTINDIVTANFGVSIPYVLMKDYRWVETESERRAIMARSWIEERGCNDGGGNCLELSFSIDVWIADGDETWRFICGWSEVTGALTGVIGDDVMIAALANGYQSIFTKSDEFFAEGGAE